MSHNKQLLGYRIQYRRLGSQLYSELNITSNITETVISTLDFQTTYEIKVNGFNEIGHGPPGIILVVKTFQEGKNNVVEAMFYLSIHLIFVYLRHCIMVKSNLC